MDMNQIKGWLDSATAEAQQLMNNPDGVDGVLMQLESKLREAPVIGETLADLPLMIALVKAWVTKQYTRVSPKVIACLVGAFLYLIKKKDLIPDSVPLLGMADDLAVLGLALKLSEPELKEFAQWRESRRA